MAHDQARGCCSDGEWVSGYNPAWWSRESCQQQRTIWKLLRLSAGCGYGFFSDASGGGGGANQPNRYSILYKLEMLGTVPLSCTVLTTLVVQQLIMRYVIRRMRGGEGESRENEATNDKAVE